MADLAALKAAVDTTEAAKAALLTERASKRAAMPKAEFKVYNFATRQKQLDIEADVKTAQTAFLDELKVIRADAVDKAIEVAVGTLSESNTAGGTE